MADRAVMGWVRLEFDYGPGHQSKVVRYRFWNGDEPPTEEEMKEITEGYFGPEVDWTCTTSILGFNDLPPEVRAAKVKFLRDSIARDTRMLARFGESP